MRTDRR